MSDQRPPPGPSEGKISNLTEIQTAKIMEIARSAAGLRFAKSKWPLVASRVARRLTMLEIEDVDAFIARASNPRGHSERRLLIPALTTNVTSFFRETHHFTHLAREVCPRLKSRARDGKPVRLWSAGCSNGAEAYSIAMTLATEIPDFLTCDIRVLGSDIDPDILSVARSGAYDAATVGTVQKDFREKFFEPAANPSTISVTDDLREIVRVRELNLLGDWPMKSQFDVIFCRNVVIYFDETFCTRLWTRLTRALRPGGTLYIGHSERIPPNELGELSLIGRTTYRREGGDGRANTSTDDSRKWRFAKG